MNNSSVPIVPGYYGIDQSDEKLQLEADKIGLDMTPFFITLLLTGIILYSQISGIN